MIAVLRNYENLIYIEINNLKKSNLLKVYLVPYYKVYDEEIKKINDSNDLRKKDIITNLWYGACLEFPLYDYDL